MQKSKYLVKTSRDFEWGLVVNTVGFEDIRPFENYPTHGHADGYYFNIEKGRILHEYQLLYIVEGEGIFNSQHITNYHVKTGDIFLLFPGEWHSYHPLKEKGWKSYWIGFCGKNIDDRLSAHFISTEKPIYRVGFSSEIINLYEKAYQIAQKEEAYYQQTLAGIVNYLIGLMYSLERNRELNKNQQQVDIVNHGKLIIRENLENNITIQEIAQHLNTSYSNFRKLFKEYMGISPAMYQQDLRLQKSKELLSSTNKSIKEIAYTLNFDSPDYFSSRFKVKTGYTPSEFRRL